MPGFTDKKFIFKLEQNDGPAYEDKCQKIVELIQSTIKAQKAENQKQVEDLMKKLRKPEPEHTEYEYKQIYGYYWLLSDSLKEKE